MQLPDHVSIERRKMLSVSAAAFAALIVGTPNGRAAAEGGSQAEGLRWRKVYGSDGKPTWLSFKEAEETYPLRFVEYLSRFLLNFDEDSRELYVSKAQQFAVLPKEKRQEARFEEFARFCTSVEYGLKAYNGTKGTAKLARILVLRYGRNNADALQQIGFLFTLLEDTQPVQEIAGILSKLENATVESIVVKDGGSGYTGDAPKVTISSRYGPKVNASATCVMRETGELLTVRMRNNGLGYTRSKYLTPKP